MVARLGTRGYTKVLSRKGANGPSRDWRSSGPPVWEDFACKNRVCGTAPTAPTNSVSKELAAVHWNLTEPALYEHAIAAGEGSIVEGGAFCAETGHHTGRSPKDKHTVVDALTENSVWWDGNRKMSE